VVFNPNTLAFVCMDCGYAEMYVDQTYRDKVRRA